MRRLACICISIGSTKSCLLNGSGIEYVLIHLKNRQFFYSDELVRLMFIRVSSRNRVILTTCCLFIAC